LAAAVLVQYHQAILDHRDLVRHLVHLPQPLVVVVADHTRTTVLLRQVDQAVAVAVV
jgi:hypothetical protein